MGQETAITLFPTLGSYIVSDTLEGGQYRNTDLPTMLSTGRGPLKYATAYQNVRYVKTLNYKPIFAKTQLILLI